MFGTFELLLNVTNAAFDEPGPETSRLLRLVADRIDQGATEGTVSDVNGNRVGSYGFVPVPTPSPIETARDLSEGLAYAGIRGSIEAATEAEPPNGFEGSNGWRVVLLGGDFNGLVFSYWTGPAITDPPTVADAVASVLLDASYVSEMWGGPEGLTRDQIETIEARERWFRSVVDGPTFERLTELAADH